MAYLRNRIPDPASLLSMTAEDIAGYVLEALLKAGAHDRGVWNRRNFCSFIMREYDDTSAVPMEIGIQISAAWTWLETNGLICRSPEQDNEWFVATAKGRDLQDRQKLSQLISNEQLPEHFLHELLLLHVRPLFFQQRFETAVFEAFKTLEVRIREAASFGPELIGTTLASRAFNPEDGPLTDYSLEKGERVALMNLMTGAVGSYKNPASHRRVEISPEEARDMIILASHLLKIVDAREQIASRP